MKIAPALFTALLLSQTSCSMAQQPTATLSLTEQQRFLQKSVQQTPFSAVVKITDVSIKPANDDSDMLWHIYSAQVISHIRGSLTGRLRFAMAVEEGEDAVIPDKPVLLTLCRASDLGIDTHFYWPGTGAMFEASEELIALAQKSAKGVDMGQTDFSLCD